jgi:hypothetical protein
MRGYQYSAKTKKEALEALAGGMSAMEVSKALNVPANTIYGWKARKPKTPRPSQVTCKVCGKVVHRNGLGPHMTKHREPFNPTIEASKPEHMTLDQFVQMLRDLTSDYIKVKEELVQLRKSSESWKITAGRALEQAQQAIHRDS